ncbi:hypothetical protein B9Q04_09475 [Candidatus Marsarchaeota G2 archaeon BE_D]|jgi:Sugar kinases, ribokinase family|uniref:Carbohydrate kinase PfkB domain-containing protein n=1 Tax=Candidatus Marsarchaeota G2 archaeon BE_D TaxID=1978158 RepID=A0A2R6C9W3_9ARCH|nr:MAG: hypothetical protein B9Q04_09475 [Candidatus Marsarchaeota G2 archaeon BE_D]
MVDALVDLSVVSDCVADEFFEVDGFPIVEGSVVLARSSVVSLGGSCTVAITASRLGLRVAVIDNVGDDAFGDMVLEGLEKEGVSVDHVRRVRGGTTSRCIVLLGGGGKHAFLGTLGPKLTEDDIPLGVLTRSRGIFFDGYTLTNMTKRVYSKFAIGLGQARMNGSKVFFDPGPMLKSIDGLDDVVDLCDVILMNESEAEAFSSLYERELAELSSVLGKTFVVKLGPNGSLVIHDGIKLYSPPFAAEVRTSVGAGDVFNGAFIWAFLSGFRYAESCMLGNLAAALKVTGIGTSSIPTRERLFGEAKKSGLAGSNWDAPK